MPGQNVRVTIWSSRRRFDGFVADNLTVFAEPGGIQPGTGSGRRSLGLGAVLSEGNQWRAIGHAQMEMRNKTAIDHVLDNGGGRVRHGIAIGRRRRQCDRFGPQRGAKTWPAATPIRTPTWRSMIPRERDPDSNTSEPALGGLPDTCKRA
jgi:hypothetical protein